MLEQKHLKILAVSMAIFAQSLPAKTQPLPPKPPAIAAPGVESTEEPLPDEPVARSPRPGILKPRPDISETEGSGIDRPEPITSAAARDKNNLVTAHGRVREYLLNLRGEVRGVILSDGIQVQARPHLQPILNQLKIGQKVTVQGYGVKSKFGTCLDAVKINTDENNSK